MIYRYPDMKNLNVKIIECNARFPQSNVFRVHKNIKFNSFTTLCFITLVT